MSDFSLIATNLSQGVFSLKLNNPQRRNALSTAMMKEISNALDVADKDANARVIVLSAEGPVFSSGHDLKEMNEARSADDNGREFFEKTMKQCSAMMQQIVNHRLPVVAMIDGTATAAGCQLVASCDLAVASDTSKFITPGVNLGLFCSTPMVALSRNASNKHAMEMLLTGEATSAERAAEIGLVNYALPLEEVDAKIAWFTDRITAKSAMTIKTGKQAYYKQSEMPLHEAYDYCANVMVENMLKYDACEGINAFLEKRTPEWRDE